MSVPVQKEVKRLKVPGVSPPKEKCSDPNCPWHGTIRVRGVILEGVVDKARARGMVVVRHDYLYYDRKYKRYERRSKRIHAHLPDCIKASEGDIVVIGETRPISKTIKFVVLGVKRRA